MLGAKNRRGSREFLVLVVVLVLGNGAIEDEDDLVGAWPRSAVSRVANPPQRLWPNDASSSAILGLGGRNRLRTCQLARAGAVGGQAGRLPYAP